MMRHMANEQNHLSAAVERARARQAVLRDEIELLSRELRDIDAFLRMLPKFAEIATEPPRSIATGALARFKALASELPKAQTVTNEVARMLEKSDVRLRTTQVLEALDLVGYEEYVTGIDAQRRLNRLSAMLSEDSRFTADRMYGWGLAGRSYRTDAVNPRLIRRTVARQPNERAEKTGEAPDDK